MKRYATTVDFSRALDARLRLRADEARIDVSRLRRILVFDRIGARLSASEHRFVLKGGCSLEFRLGGRARATRDIDLTLCDGPHDGDALRELLIETLADDVDQDSFTFAVRKPTPLEADKAGRPGWRFSVDSFLAGKTYAQIKLDVVLRGEELAEIEMIGLPGILAFVGVPARMIESVGRRQHFAEKLHALTRDYDSRPNTRVKDLVDMVLLIEDGLRPDSSLLVVVNHVFAVRSTHPVPRTVPEPPLSWATAYPTIARDLTDAQADLSTALVVLRSFWTRALTTETEL